MMKKAKKRAKEEIVHLQEVTGPHPCRMIAQEGFPGLSTRSFFRSQLQILLNGPFTYPNIQLEQLTPNALCSPETIGCRHFPDQVDCLQRKSRCSLLRFRFVLPEDAEDLTVPAQQGLWLDKKERLFPGLDHPGQEYEKKSVRLPVYWSLDLPTQDDQLLAQERVFHEQFGFASGEIGKGSKDQRCCWWFDPPGNTFLKFVQSEKTHCLIERRIESINRIFSS